MFVLKKIDELIDENPGWKHVEEWMSNAKNSVEVLAASKADRKATLLDMQVTTKSIFGSIIYETGGLLIDSGWIRILGSGCKRLPRRVSNWNQECLKDNIFEMPYHLIADDVTGGFYAYDAGGLGHKGSMFYFAPDRMAWEDMNLTYPEFVSWCMNVDLDQYYGDTRFEGWFDEVKALPGDKAFLYLPLLCMKAQKGKQRERKTVTVKELFELYVNDLALQLADIPDGQIVELKFEI